MSPTALSPFELANFKASQRSKLLLQPESLADAASRAWAPLRTRTYIFNARQLKAACLAEVQLSDLLALYDTHLGHTALGKAALCCAVQSCTKQPLVQEQASEAGSRKGMKRGRGVGKDGMASEGNAGTLVLVKESLGTVSNQGDAVAADVGAGVGAISGHAAELGIPGLAAALCGTGGEIGRRLVLREVQLHAFKEHLLPYVSTHLGQP